MILRRLGILLFFIVLGSCRQPAEGLPPGGPPAPMPQPVINTTHDHGHPPIDCPLRKAGVDPHGMKPFDDVEKYIAFLEREDRAVWQKPDTVIDALRLAGSEVVADIGAGSGYFTFRFAKALPQGKVVAIDIEPEMIRHIHHRTLKEGWKNIEAVVAKQDDPMVPDGVDMVFICDVLHHVKERNAWLKKLSTRMKSGSKMVFIEFKEGDLPAGPPAELKIPRSKMISLAADSGFTLMEEKTTLTPYQYFLIFTKP